MKKLLFLAVMIAFGATSANAQFKAGFGLGYAFPTGDITDFADGGISGYGEIGYGINENFDISLLYQGDFLIGADVSGGSLENITMSSFLANARYFFGVTKFKPYVGLGLGFTDISQDDLAGFSGSGVDESNFGIRPSVGFKYGVLNVNAAYLSAGKIEDTTVSDFTINVGLLFTFGVK
ncbi:outer membrane beta-barrel protein [Leptobacterium sp. I13]|uniref:outer membrane beta-barrel protein n=1 Tax=Leptobacterium meishanense TaxID=3128904 RepID=UPI0030EE6B7F